jgi:hypothetical protein
MNLRAVPPRLGESPWLRARPGLGFLYSGFPKRNNKLLLGADFHEVTDRYPELPSQKVQRPQRWVSGAPFELREKPRGHHVGGSIQLGQPAEPPSPSGVGAHLAPEPREVHAASGPALDPILETTKGMIIVDRATRPARLWNVEEYQ